MPKPVRRCVSSLILLFWPIPSVLPAGEQLREPLKAYCIDFNWGEGGPNGFARPGLWADADPAKHVAWYRALGANVRQTFCVSCNGYAWYKHGVVPEQPGLKHDFLTESSRMYQQIDWLMNEAGDIERVQAMQPMIGKHTRLLTCLANWNAKDPTAIVPVALHEGIGLYGFTRPQADSLVPLEPCLTQPVSQLTGDARNIGALARAYHGVPLDSGQNEQGEFAPGPR